MVEDQKSDYKTFITVSDNILIIRILGASYVQGKIHNQVLVHT